MQKRLLGYRGCVVVPLPAQLIGNTMCLWLPSILVNKKSQALLSLAFWLTTLRLTSYRWQSLPHPRSSLYCNADDDDLQYRLHIIDFDARRSAKEAFKDFCLRLAQLAARLWQPGSTGSSSSSIYSSWIRKNLFLEIGEYKKEQCITYVRYIPYKKTFNEMIL